MTYSTAIRNLRNGALVIKDGSDPVNTCTIACDMGDLSWTVAKEFQEQRCRGVLTGKREGDEQGCQVSFTVKVQQLIGYTENTSDPITPYEILHNVGDTFTTTASNGDHYATTLVFTLSDPNSANSGTDETVTFPTFACESLEFGEGDAEDTISVSGTCLEVAPTIARV